MNEKELKNALRHISLQISTMQRTVAMLKKVIELQLSVYVVVGVKDVTAAQLYDAYKRGLSMEQLVQLLKQ